MNCGVNMTGKHTQAATSGPNASMKMSPEARARMRATEKAIYRYYNDMGRDKGNCTWGAGILAYKGVCTEDELKQKVSASMVDQEFERRVADAEKSRPVRCPGQPHIQLRRPRCARHC